MSRRGYGGPQADGGRELLLINDEGLMKANVMRWYLRFINVENMLVFSGTVCI